MIRLFIYFLLICFIYRTVKGLFKSRKQVKPGPRGEVIDEMVQDPYCKTYVPRKDAVKKVIDGQEYSFCSTECAEKFNQK